MIKRLALGIIALTFMLRATHVFAAAGIFGTDIGLNSDLINSGTNTFFEADLLGDSRHAPLSNPPFVTLPVDLNTTGFNTLNLGTFDLAAGDTLNFIGGEALTFKNSGTDVTGTTINYSIDGGPFTSFSLTFNEDNVNGT